MRVLRILHTPFLICAAQFAVTLALADLPRLDPLARPGTRIGPGFQVGLNVVVKDYDEKELCKVFTVDSQGRLQLTMGGEPLDKISLMDATADEAVKKVSTAIRKFYKVDPQVKVGIVRIPRVRVEVFGATFWTGPIFLAVGAHLSDVLTEARYFPNADLSRVRLERSAKDGSRVRVIADFQKALDAGAVEDAINNPLVESGDIITLETKPEILAPQTFGIHGEVRQPGFYPFKKGMTVRDAFKEGLDLLPTADPDSVTVIRTRQSLTYRVNAQRAIEGIEIDNMELRPDDIVFVGKRDRGMRYSVAGEVAAPFTADFKGEVTLTQALVTAGGFRGIADRKNVILSRNMIHDPAHPNGVVIDYDKIASGQQPDVKLQAGDVVNVLPKRKQTSPLLQIGFFLLRRFLPF